MTSPKIKSQQIKLDKQHATLIKLLFKQLDKDKTGIINKEELLKLIYSDEDLCESLNLPKNID